MDPIFTVVFPIVAFLFLATDWPRLKQMSRGIKLAYAVFFALSCCLFATRTLGIEPLTPPYLFYTYVSPAIESMLGLQ
ncbi:hypothetical protein SD70_19850 [Gordoniibacillus kamchatkensis]|uniref:Uncharacterized protein n=1 Tax=Gordoniibacillus kamchatkensis TaxID=1590651 RepID=A0ABR5AEG7_9BACL|nr:hypothetical protein [Paenibacillus sp. VKM B-2647]KIL39436.1 hypothetical protein SD70_19850 [Paenibacillus sp. VKM B-2647]